MTTVIINIMYVIQRQFKSTSTEHHVISSLKWTESSAYFARVINFNTESIAVFYVRSDIVEYSN